jgi:transmembrane sensor
MEKQRIAYLYQQYMNGTASAEEQEEWAVLLNNTGVQKDIQEIVDASYYSMPDHEMKDLEGNRSEEIFNHITGVSAQPVKRTLWPRMAVAASFFIVLSAGIWFYHTESGKGQSGSNQIINDIAPGKNTAKLTLANGKSIDLSDQKTGLVVHAASFAYNDGTAVPQTASEKEMESTEALSLNTPRGGTYQVVLSDGTKVWLNAASSLKFPATFSNSAGNRLVELTGEAYFEVAKDRKHPFIVKTARQEVEVLGTHFNINSYTDTGVSTTTLLEGSVHLSGTGLNDNLKPGQKAILDASHHLRIEPANLKEAVAWKNGYFRFNAARIDEVMVTLARWYNIEVVFEGPVSEEKFSGHISRNIKISEVLNMLSYSKAVKFKVEGRRVTVMK